MRDAESDFLYPMVRFVRADRRLRRADLALLASEGLGVPRLEVRCPMTRSPAGWLRSGRSPIVAMLPSRSGMPRTQRSALAERLAGHLDQSAADSLARQIVNHVWEEVVSGELDTGSRLPTIRQLAIDLGLNPKTVARAYDELERLGVVSARPGEGTFVSVTVPDGDVRDRHRQLEEIGREALTRTEGLGFTIADLIDTLDDLRSAKRGNESAESP